MKKRKEENIRRQIRRLIRPHKRLLQLNRHLLDRLRPPHTPIPTPIRLLPSKRLDLHVATNRNHPDAVQPTQVVAEIQLVEVEGDDEGGETGREEGGAEEADCEVGTGFSC